MFLDVGSSHLETPGMERKRFRGYQTPSPLDRLMSRTENKSRGAQLTSTPGQESAGNWSGRCWQGWGVISPVPSYPPHRGSLLPPLGPQHIRLSGGLLCRGSFPVDSQCLKRCPKFPNLSWCLRAVCLMRLEGKTSLGHFG